MTRPHTIEKKRIKTVRIGGVVEIPTMEAGAEIAGSYAFQDDVRVIGCQLGAEALVEDAALNADGRFEIGTQLNATGNLLNQTVILNTEIKGIWTGILGHLPDLRKQNSILVPDGHGWDFDAMQMIYLIIAGQNYTLVDPMKFFGWAIVYFVER